MLQNYYHYKAGVRQTKKFRPEWVIMNSHNYQLPLDLIAQLVEQWTSITEVRIQSSNPLHA